MMRNKILLASSALALALISSPSPVLADGALACSDITQVRYMLQKYAVNDPDNYCIRAMTLAEANPSMREEVIRESNKIASKHGIESVTAGCPKVAGYVAPAPQPVLQQQSILQYQAPPQQTMGYVYQQPAPVVQQVYTPPVATVVTDTSRYTAGHASLFSGSSLLWGGLGLLAAGGTAAALITGSSSSTGTVPATVDEFITDEYKAQYSLTTMDAASAYRRGYTGEGITVALLDTGLDLAHSEFDGRYVTGGGFDFVTGNSGQAATGSLNEHGTQVAGVLAANRNFVGMHGVAYNSKILPLRVFDEAGGGIASFEDAIDYARNQGSRILNGSYGPDDAWHTNFEAEGYQGIQDFELAEADAYKRYASAGGILVFPAGNARDIAPGLANNPTGPGFLPFIKPSHANITDRSDGAYRASDGSVLASADYSILETTTIVVAGVDKDNEFLPFSNRCGVAKNWCMVAAAENIYTTTTGGGYTTVSGTSFAAPQVSGAIAVLKQEFPNLSPGQIVARLLRNAKDLGVAGIDEVYGWGLLDLEAATNPNGLSGISTSTEIARTHSLAGTNMRYGAAFGETAAAAFNNVSVLFLDQDHAAFRTGMNRMVNVSVDRFDTEGALTKFDRADERQEVAISDNTSLGFVMEGKKTSDRAVGDKPKDPNDTHTDLNKFALTQTISETTQGSVHYKDSDALSLGFSDGDRARLDRAISKDALTNPYANFAGDGYASIIKTEGLGGTVKVAGFFGHDASDKEANNFGTQAELAYNLDKGSDAYISIGSLFEENRVLGSKGSGALSFGNGTSTTYIGVGGKYALSDSLTLRATGYAGYTKPSLNSAESLIKDMSDIITSSFNAGVERKGNFLKEDSFGFGVSQPLRVESGNMQFSVPYALDVSDNLLATNSFTQDLSAQGREMDMEVNYAVPVGKDETVSAGALYRLDAGHVSGKNDALGVMRWSKKF